MGTDSITCPTCGAQGSAGDRFCGSCGTVMGGSSGAGKNPQAGSRKATMLGMTSVPPPAESPAAVSKPPVSSRKATMLGMTSVPPPGEGAQSRGANPEAAGSPSVEAQDDPALQRTVLGMQSPLAEGSPDSGPPPASGGGRTVFGVDASDSQPPREATAPGAPAMGRKGTMLGMQSPLAAASPDPAATPAASRQSAANAKGRTMLGMVSPLAGGSPPPDEEASRQPARAGSHGDAQTNRTMLGMTQPGAPEPEAASETAEPAPSRFTPPGGAPSFSRPHEEEDGERSSGVPALSSGGKRGPGVGLWLGVGAVLCAAVAAALLLTSGGPQVSADVIAGKQGDTLRVRLPEAAPGTKVRFAGAEAEVSAGVADFPLASDALKVGDNHVTLDVVEPDGDVDSATLDLRVDYRARLDLSGLEGEQPAVAVVVDAVPGSSVQVAGESVDLDGAGRARVAFPVEDSPGSRFDLEVPYRIEPPQGSAVEGTLELHLPVVSMQIDRPGEEVFTDADHIEIGGAVEDGASVHVSGKPVKVNDGRFLHSQPLGGPGEYRFQVVARAPGKAPSAREVKVTRVEDMGIAAAAFEFDPGLSYARIAQNPAIYRGQHVAFDGRVYNVEVQGGRSILQMLVRDCPRGHKCQLWVDYAQATDATVGSMVRVMGVVSGEQQYRSKKGGVQTAPSVSARFVLPLVK